jgi:hypothetical protein
MFYGNLVLLLHFFKLSRAPMNDAALSKVFPAFRAEREASVEMDPIDDQVSVCDPQALPWAAGIKLTPRDPEELAKWLTEGHMELDQWERPLPTNDSESLLNMADPGIRGHY